MAKHTNIPDELRRQITKAIYEASDVGDVVLRGHLYVEFVLNELFITRWPDTGKPLAERFSFDQKITIAEATQLIGGTWALGNMRALNRLRNLYAHALFPTGVEEQISDMPSLDPQVDSRNLDPLQKIKGIFLCLCSFLAGAMNAITGAEGTPDWLILGSWKKDDPTS